MVGAALPGSTLVLWICWLALATLGQHTAARATTKPPMRHEQTQTHMGTTFKLTFYCDDEATASQAGKLAFARIGEIDSILSDYKSDSELSRLNRAAGGPAQPVSEDFFAVLARAREMHACTDGAFDISVGPAVRLWRRSRRSKRLPTLAARQEALAKMGFNKVRLDHQAKTVALTQPGMLLDAGGIAKGWACDEALKILRQHGITRALVDGGGGVSVGEPPPGKSGWQIAIAAPGRVPGQPLRLETTLLLAKQAVATSGDAERSVEIDGKRYSHIVDPQTGLGLTRRIQASVVDPDGATADALATALCVLGPEKGLAFIESRPYSAALILQMDEKGQILRYPSRRWPRLIGVGIENP